MKDPQKDWVNHELAFHSDWSLGEDAYRAIVTDIQEFGGNSVVEFGSGISTVRLSHDLPLGSIFSIESDLAWLNETRRLKAKAGAGQVSLKLRPLALQWHGCALYESYELGPFPSSIDAVLIDGPPMATRRGREACLYQVMKNLRVGGRVYLDDYCRPFERQVVSNWLRAYSGSLTIKRVIDVGHTICVLEKVAAADAPTPSIQVLVDSNQQNALRIIHSVRRRLGLLPGTDTPTQG